MAGTESTPPSRSGLLHPAPADPRKHRGEVTSLRKILRRGASRPRPCAIRRAHAVAHPGARPRHPGQCPRGFATSTQFRVNTVPMPRPSLRVSLISLVALCVMASPGLAMSGTALAQEAPAGHDARRSRRRDHLGRPTHRARSGAVCPRCWCRDAAGCSARCAAEGGQSSEQAFTSLQRQTGAHLRVLHFYHGGTQLFPSSWEIKLSNQGHRLLLNWKPETGHTWAQVAAGASDSYIDREAAYLRSHYAKKKFFLVIHHEPEEEVRDVAARDTPPPTMPRCSGTSRIGSAPAACAMPCTS